MYLNVPNSEYYQFYYIPNDNPVDREVAVLAAAVLPSPNSAEPAPVVPAAKLNPVALLAGAVAAKVLAVVAAPNCKPAVDAGVPKASALAGAAEETGKFSPTVAGADDAGVPNVRAVAGACEEAGVLKVSPVVGADVRPTPGAEDAEGVPKVKPETDAHSSYIVEPGPVLSGHKHFKVVQMLANTFEIFLKILSFSKATLPTCAWCRGRSSSQTKPSQGWRRRYSSWSTKRQSRTRS